MTWSYSQPIGGVYQDKKDEVRFLLRDTVETQFSISDEEIYYLLDFFDSKPFLAASQAALSMAVEYAKEAAITSKSVGDLSLSLSYTNTSEEYKHLSQHLRLGKINTTLNAYFDPQTAQFGIGQFDQHRP